MTSTAIKGNQMQLDFEPGLVDRYGSLKDCVATGVYQRGLKRVAIDLDQAPSNLSVQLSEDGSRHFSIDSFEKYIEKTKDFTPIYYLVEKFLSDRTKGDDAALEQFKAIAPDLLKILSSMGART
jgi:hypothetical protein